MEIMNYKSLKLSSKIAILLNIVVDSQDDIKVYINAYWINNDEHFKYKKTSMNFLLLSSAQSFIEEFSEASALEWFENLIPEDEE